jgi:hypothetical protein
MLIAAMLFASCEKFLDVNTDPNNPTEVSPNLILSVGQHFTAQMIQGTDDGRRTYNTLGNMMMYNWSQSDGYAWYPDEFKYNVTASFYQDIFNFTYPYSLKQYNLLDLLEEEDYVYYKAIGKIMKAYHFQLLVDTYGDIPYSEAMQRSANPTPKYDDAQTIYEDLIVQLSAAIDLIKNAVATAENPANSDVMFNGDMQEWIRFANTLKLRILVRQSDMAGRDTYIQNEIDAIIAEGSGYITTDVGVNPGYLNSELKQNPLWSFYGLSVTGAASMNGLATCATDYILDYLETRNDPRLDSLYELPATGHLGVPQGYLDYDTPIKDQFIPANVSNIGPGILKSYNMGAIIFTLAESYFNQAEAAQKAYTTDDAQTLYESGIQASFDYLGAGSAATYYSQGINNVGWSGSLNKIEAIITQKWLAVNGITAEQSWFDYNRTGFPSGLPISLQASKPDRPVRLFYPSSELSANSANVPPQPDAFTDKIFWAN